MRYPLSSMFSMIHSATTRSRGLKSESPICHLRWSLRLYVFLTMFS